METSHHRINLRLEDYDYSSGCYYFVTVVSHQRKNRFGKIVDGEMNLNQIGLIVEETWQEIPLHFPYVEVDLNVVMPNHFHGILIINDTNVGARHVGAQHQVSRFTKTGCAPT